MTNPAPLGELRRWLQRPFPLWRGAANEAAAVLSLSLGGGLLIGVTRPFGLGSLPAELALSLVLQATAVALSCGLLLRVALPAAVERWGESSGWRVGHELVWTLIEVLLLAAALYAMLRSQSARVFLPLSPLGFVAITALCAVPAIGLRTLWQEHRHRQAHQTALPAMAIAPTQLREWLCLRASDGELVLALEALRYVQAEQNYVRVVWWQQARLQQRLLRIPLHSLEEQVLDQPLLRCHRSYIVALPAIRAVDGNAQGYRLQLADVEAPIPVARNRINEFLQRWRAHQSTVVATQA